MSTTVTYKGNTIATVDNSTKTLMTQGKYLEDNITLTDVGGSAIDGDNLEYGLTDGTLPMVGVGKIESAVIGE